MSWGGPEFAGETSLDSLFRTPAGHGGVTCVAGFGNSGPGVAYPAASPNVVSVGGTKTLAIDAAGDYRGEAAWSGSGGGITPYEPELGYQVGVQSEAHTPDVAYDADPSTAVAVYDSYNGGSATPWTLLGGTSVGTPQWAALFAIANQGRTMMAFPRSMRQLPQALTLLYDANAGDFTRSRLLARPVPLPFIISSPAWAPRRRTCSSRAWAPLAHSRLTKTSSRGFTRISWVGMVPWQN